MWPILSKNKERILASTPYQPRRSLIGSKFTAFREKAHLAVSIALVLLSLLFILQNIEQTQISFLFWTISTSRSIMLLVTMLVGVIIGLVAVLGKRVHPVQAYF
ncbi:LapA family protein [Pseudodesulfovibrio methanolicus]|uniref:LapA family protein n=1 Tax=Pseudodesulfovibrio methanolicus TaxID=3126690 RepID=UPI003BB214E8